MSSYEQLRKTGWSDESARQRARVIDQGNAVAASWGRGTPNLHRVATLCNGDVREGIVIDGRLSVGGCHQPPGAVSAILTQPYRMVGGDLWTRSEGETVAHLGDGTEVVLGQQDRVVYSVLAAGRTFTCVMDAALALTPVA